MYLCRCFWNCHHVCWLKVVEICSGDCSWVDAKLQLCCSVRTLAHVVPSSLCTMAQDWTLVPDIIRHSHVFCVGKYICRTFCPETLRNTFVLLPSHRQAGHGRWVKDWGCHFEVLEPQLLSNICLPLTPSTQKLHVRNSIGMHFGCRILWSLHVFTWNFTHPFMGRFCFLVLSEAGSMAKFARHSGRLSNTGLN